MHALTGERLLEAWDRGFNQSDLTRPLTLLGVSCPERSTAEIAGLSLAERDLDLWRLRRLTFGEWLRATLPCAGCAQQIEFTLALTTVVEPLERLSLAMPPQKQIEGWNISMRPVTTSDLEAVLAFEDAESAKQALMERCGSFASSDGTISSWRDASEAARTAAMELFEAMHEGAEFTCETVCPQCGAVDLADLDIGRFLWFEVRNAARRLLLEIHELASAYGWSEAAILGMSPQRRQGYLAMVRA
jgi:hypothetical protein